MELADHYWDLVLWDDERIAIKPQHVDKVKQMLTRGEGMINLPNRSIQVKNVKDFLETDRPHTDQKLLEGAASAFNEPQYTVTGAVKAVWVTKSVPRREWNKFYSPSGYRLLKDLDHHVAIAWRVPIHMIDRDKTRPLNFSELELIKAR